MDQIRVALSGEQAWAVVFIALFAFGMLQWLIARVRERMAVMSTISAQIVDTFIGAAIIATAWAKGGIPACGIVAVAAIAVGVAAHLASSEPHP
jgi:hypothetical protein